MASAACFSTMLFMSSCSKEDVAMPSPEANVLAKDGSNLKISSLEIVPPTTGQLGLGSLPTGYTDGKAYNGLSLFGLSNSRYLFGNTSTPWLPANNAAPKGAGTFLTLGAKKDKATAITINVKNLGLYKRYKFTYYVSTLAIKNSSGLGHTPYAFALELSSHYLEIGPYHFGDFTGKENQWLEKNVEFRSSKSASETTAEFKLWLYGNSNATSYGNIFIPKEAVQEID